MSTFCEGVLVVVYPWGCDEQFDTGFVWLGGVLSTENIKVKLVNKGRLCLL